MTRDYKPAAPKQKSSGKGSSFFTGFMIGLILGVGISVGVAILVKDGDSPFVNKVEQAPQAEGSSSAEAVAAAPDKSKTPEAAAQEKPRFDFYTILPGTESQVTEQEIQQTKAQQATPTVTKENYFLQVGAFQNEADADNMKAKLALLGMEAVVQTANVPDKGVWHRVRVGPFTDIDQISKARTELTRNGFNVDLIKIHSNIPDQ